MSNEQYGNENDTTGVGNDEINNNQHENNELYDKQHQNENHDDDKNIQDIDISIENRLPDDIYVTINDVVTVHKMNARQLNVNPDTGEIEEETRNTRTPTHTYNLRPRPTKRNQKYNMTLIRQQ